MHEDNGVAGARRQQAVELEGGATVPSQRVDDLVMLLDAAQQLQTGSLVDVYAPAGKYEMDKMDGCRDRRINCY